MGPLRKFGETSVTKIAIPMAIGIAMLRARNVVTNVPNMVVAAPKDSLTGSQSVDVRNFMMPNFWMARWELVKRT